MTRTARPTRRGRPFAVLAVFAASALLMGACSDDDDAATDGSDSTRAPSAALGEADPATGEPVLLGYIGASGSDTVVAGQSQRAEDGMQMAIDYANEHRGGIGGRPIELVVCSGGETPAGSQDCANQMVNRGVTAVVLPFTGNGAAIVPIITGAGIPYVTLSAAAPEELLTPGVFSLTGGFPTTLAAFAAHARDEGYEKFSLLGIDVPTVSQAAAALGAPLFQAAGVELEFTAVPLGAPDMTPQVQAAVDGGADAMAIIGDITFCASFLQAYETLALDVPRYLVSLCSDPANSDAVNAQMEGAFMVGSTVSDADNPDVELYGAIAEAFGGDIDPDPAFSTGQAAGATTILTLVNMLEDLTGEVTAASVLAHLQATTDVPLFLGGGSTLTCNGMAVPTFANICSAHALIGTVDGDGAMRDAELLDTAPLFQG